MFSFSPRVLGDINRGSGKSALTKDILGIHMQLQFETIRTFTSCKLKNVFSKNTAGNKKASGCR